MKTTIPLVLFCSCAVTLLNAQTPVDDGTFKIALPDHAGQLQWRAEGFKTIEASAKQNGHEIGVRATNQSGRLAFLSFLFLIPEEAPLTSAKCRDGILKEMKRKNNILPGESIPDPTKDDSFLPYRENKEFWAFLTSLH